MEQQYIIEHALYEMYTEFLIATALAGKTPFTVAELLANKERYMAHEFVGRGWPWTQPLQESNANKIGLETNQTTLARIAAEKGLDWRDELDQREIELEYIASKKILGGGGDATSTEK
jgi:capsid protein